MERFKDLHNLFGTSLSSLRKVEANSCVRINVATSLSPDGLPARFLAGFIPPFVLAEALKTDLGLNPRVRNFIPINLGIFCNEICPTQARSVVFQAARWIESFRKTFHPSIPLQIEEDQPFSDDTALILKRLWEEVSNDPQNQRSDVLERFEKSPKPNATLYATHHVFGWEDCASPIFFRSSCEIDQEQIVLNSMSQSEREFQPVRREVARAISRIHPEMVVPGMHMDLMTHRCPGPHYLRSGNSHLEPSLDDLTQDGFSATEEELVDLIRENPKFLTALKDLRMIGDHIEGLRKKDPNLPTIDAFIEHIGGLA